jgi:uncharacterized iron-regulated membrane protein
VHHIALVAVGSGPVAACLLFLPAALIVMLVAAYTLWRDERRAQSARQRQAAATRACRLGALSSLLLALASLGCLSGPAPALGWAMIILGGLGAAAAYVVYRRYLAEPDRIRPGRRP